MSKQRPFISPPILTPPSVVVPRETERAAIEKALIEGATAVAELAPPVAIPPQPALVSVPPPARVATVELLSDRILLTNPTIELHEYVMLPDPLRAPGTPPKQVKRLTPDRATVMHGMIDIPELGLLIPVSAGHITTR
jgi:hypothetical protein